MHLWHITEQTYPKKFYKKWIIQQWGEYRFNPFLNLILPYANKSNYFMTHLENFILKFNPQKCHDICVESACKEMRQKGFYYYMCIIIIL